MKSTYFGVLLSFLLSTVSWGFEFQNDPSNALDQLKVKLPQKEGTFLGVDGSVKIEGNSGAGSYVYPLDIPKWHDFVPELSLSYSTSHGQGILGQGWQLSIPYINRIFHQGTPTSARPIEHSVQGRLLEQSSGYYYPRLVGKFNRYQLQDDGSFKVEDELGNIWIYGADTSSRESNAFTDFKWHLNSITDPFGNTFTISYAKVSEVSYPTKMVMTSSDNTAAYELLFSYAVRTDPWLRNDRGVPQTLKYRIVQVQTNYLGDGQTTRKSRMAITYDDTVERSLIKQITSYGKTDTDRKPAVSFVYSELADITQGKIYELDVGGVNPQYYNGAYRFIDINADGLTDILSQVSTADGSRWFIWLNQGDGQFTPERIAEEYQSFDYLDTAGGYLDLDGDRKLELIRSSFSTSEILVRANTFDSPESAPWSLTGETIDSLQNTPFSSSTSLIDLDGNGRTDIVNYGTSTSLSIKWNMTSADAGTIFYSGSGNVSALDNSIISQRRFADFNADGIPDIYSVNFGSSGSGTILYALHQRYGLFSDQQRINIVFDGALTGNSYLSDLNGDGILELIVWLGGTSVNVFSLDSSGSTPTYRLAFRFTDNILSSVGLTAQDITVINFADINGNGSTDIILTSSTQNKSVYYDVYDETNVLSPAQPYLLTQIYSELGSTSTLSYKPSIISYDSTSFDGRFASVLQTIDELKTVGLSTSNESIASQKLSSLTEYAFSDIRFDATDNQLLGYAFKTERSYQDEAKTKGTLTDTEYFTDEFDSYLKGYIKKQTSYSLQSSNQLLSQLQQDWTLIELGDGVRYPLLQLKTERNYEHGVLGEVKQTHAQISIDPSLMIPLSSQETLTNGENQVLRTVSYDYDTTQSRYLPNLISRIRLLDDLGATVLQKEFEYNSYGRLSALHSGFGSQTRTDGVLSYDSFGNVATHVDAIGHEVIYSYDEETHSKIISSQEQVGSTVLTQSYDYDLVIGQPIRAYDYNHTAAAPVFSAFSWDGLGRLKTITEPGESEASYTFAYNYGNGSSYSTIAMYSRGITDPVVSYYDSLGRKAFQILPSEAGSLISDLTILDLWSKERFKSRAEVLSSDVYSVIPSGLTGTNSDYDEKQRPLTQQLAHGGTLNYYYDNFINASLGAEGELRIDHKDSFGRTCAVETFSQRASSFDAVTALPDCGIDSSRGSHQLSFDYDPADRIKVVDMTDRAPVNYSFDAFGQLANLSSELFGVQQRNYDARGLLTSVVRHGYDGSAIGTVFYRYDELKRLIEKRSTSTTASNLDELYGAAPIDFSQVYDHLEGGSYTLGQLTQILLPDSERVDLSYNIKGEISNEKAMTANGRQHITSYTYDHLGRLTSILLPESSQINYQYLAKSGSLAGIGGLMQASISYDDLMQVIGLDSRFSSSDTLSQSMSYYSDKRLLENWYVSFGQSQFVLNQSYGGYDNSLQLTGINGQDAIINQLEKSFAYDGVGQLTSVSSSLGIIGGESKEATYEYMYDLGFAKVNNFEGAFVQDLIGGHLQGITLGDKQFSFDAAGRMVSSPELTAISWTGDNRLDQVSLKSGTQLSYRYLPDNKRFKKVIQSDGSTSSYYYLNQYVEYDDSTNAYRLKVFLNDQMIGRQLANGKREFILRDAVGSDIMVVDESGMIVGRKERLAFGEPWFAQSETDELSVGFSGAFEDPNTGLVHMQNRYYSSELGRFLSPDPLFLEQAENCLESPVECNLYGFARNNPLKYVDPSGLNTVMLGGAGYENETVGYMNVLANKFEQAGVVKPEYLPISSGGQAGNIVRTLKHMSSSSGDSLIQQATGVPNLSDRVFQKVVNASNVEGGQRNLVGYSYGSVVAAQSALKLANDGIKVDNVALIGSPINSDSALYESLLNHPNIGNVTRVDIPNDPFSNGIDLTKIFDMDQHFIYMNNDQGQQDALSRDISSSFNGDQ